MGLAQSVFITPKSNSPYSRFGLGDPVDQFFVHSAAMGGLSAAFHNPYYLNLQNPASLARLRATAFETGIFGRYSVLQGEGQTDNNWGGNLQYMALGFPIQNPINKALDRRLTPFSWGMSFSLVPFTQVGYSVEVETQGEEGVEGTQNILKGSGGTYRVVWGNGFRYKNFSAGINLGYYFGKIKNNRRIEFDSLEVSFDAEFLTELSVGGLVWGVGTQYVHWLDEGESENEGKRVTFGAHAGSVSGLNTRSARFFTRDNRGFTILDTILIEQDIPGEGKMPLELGVGAIYQELNRFMVGVDLQWSNWSEYRNDAKPEALMDSWRLSAGTEFIPDYTSYNNYFERIRYRLGFYYSNDPRNFGGEQLKDYGISLGMGFPVIRPRQQISFVNLAVQAGRFGLSGLLRENYVKISLGFTLNDNTWFFKRKFN